MPTSASQMMAIHHAVNRVAASKNERWRRASPAAAGIGMPTKYLRSGRPGLRGCASWLMLKRARREAPPIRNRKQMKAPACSRCTLQIGH